MEQVLCLTRNLLCPFFTFSFLSKKLTIMAFDLIRFYQDKGQKINAIEYIREYGYEQGWCLPQIPYLNKDKEHLRW